MKIATPASALVIYAISAISTATLISALYVSLGAASISHADPYGETSDEQRASLSSDEKVAEYMAKMNAKCGTAITAAIEWKTYASITQADRGDRTADNVYGIAGGQAADVVGNLTSSCEDDLFKKNMAKKVKSIVFRPTKGKVSGQNPSHTFALSSGVLTVTYNFQSSNDSMMGYKKLI